LYFRCLAFVRRPGSVSLAKTPRCLRPAVSGCVPGRRSTPGNPHASTLRTRCSFETQAQGRHAAPRTAPSQGDMRGYQVGLALAFAEAADNGCQRLYDAAFTAPGRQRPDRQGRTGALRRRNWPGGRLHTRGSGRYPAASHGPSPSHLSYTGALGTPPSTLAWPASERSESARRSWAASSHRREKNLSIVHSAMSPRACMTCHISTCAPFRLPLFPRRPRPRIRAPSRPLCSTCLSAIV
jgi:hypothetical protein